MPDFGGLEVSAVNDDVVVEDSVSGKSVCPDCGKLLTVTAAGNIHPSASTNA